MKLYLAGPFFDNEQIKRIKNIEQALNDNPTVDTYFSPRNSDYLLQNKPGSKAWSEEVFSLDVNEIKKADAIIAIIDFTNDSVDSGTAFEIGYAHAINKPVVLFHEKDGMVNLMLTNGSNSYLTKVDDVAKYDFNKMIKYTYDGPVF